MDALQVFIDTYFPFLFEKYNFQIIQKQDYPEHYNDGFIVIKKGNMKITFTRDREDISVQFSSQLFKSKNDYFDPDILYKYFYGEEKNLSAGIFLNSYEIFHDVIEFIQKDIDKIIELFSDESNTKNLLKSLNKIAERRSDKMWGKIVKKKRKIDFHLTKRISRLLLMEYTVNSLSSFFIMAIPLYITLKFGFYFGFAVIFGLPMLLAGLLRIFFHTKNLFFTNIITGIKVLPTEQNLYIKYTYKSFKLNQIREVRLNYDNISQCRNLGRISGLGVFLQAERIMINTTEGKFHFLIPAIDEERIEHIKTIFQDIIGNGG